MTRRQWIGSLGVATLAAALGAGCARKQGEPRIYTDTVLSRAEVMNLIGFASLGKNAYAVVNRDWLLWAYDDYRKWIAEGAYGIVKWDDKSQCTFFATAFEVFAQKRFFAHSFHGSIKADGIAVGTLWYLPSAGAALGHAVNVVITARGREFFEPQTGKFIDVTAAQMTGAYFRKMD